MNHFNHIMHRYILQPYKGPSTRYRCPACNKPRRFTFYIDTQTGQTIHPTVGRCDREINCGYHLTPRQYFEQERSLSFGQQTTDDRPQKTAHYSNMPPVLTVDRGLSSVANNPPSFIPGHFLTASATNYHNNHFITYLVKLFGEEVTGQLIFNYRIGTSKHWQGATVFWQIDKHNNIRTGKIMLYSPDTGKRVKEPFNHISWVHTLLKQPQFNLQQCLFGEHLLSTCNKPIALVESEKTAIIASAHMPQYTWLATGGLSNLTAQTCACLKNRPVTLFPDLNAFDKWQLKAQQLSHIAQFNVSSMLEEIATDKERLNGLDLGDYLVRADI